MSNIKKNREDFIKIFNENISRDGAKRLLAWLDEKSDFFTAPASTKYHGNYDGGLCEHSLNVYKRLKGLQTEESNETIAICALLHDICKTNFYVKDKKNVKGSDGKWTEQDYWKIEDKLMFGHGEGSVYILSSFINLSREEALAIRWHMCGFDNSARGGSMAINAAYDKFPLCAKIAAADLLSTYVDEVK